MEKLRLLINSLSLLANRLIQGVATFTLTTVIARNLGAEQLGQYVLAIGYYYVFVTFFGMGLRTLFTRELAGAREKTPVYLVTGSLLQLFLSIIAYVLLAIVVFLMPYSEQTSRICYIMGLTVIPFALSNITEAIFQAQERMHLIVASTSPIYILRLGISILVVSNSTSDVAIERISAVMAISELAILILQWGILMRTVKPNWQIDRQLMVDSFNSARTLFAINSVGVIAGKLDVLLISLLGNEVLIGIYGAIRQLIQPFEIISSSLCAAAFPRMVNAVTRGRGAQRKNTENLLDILLCISMPLIPTVFFHYGYEILIFVYKKPEFSQGEIPLKIVGLLVLFFPIVRLTNYVLLANKLEKYNLVESLITTSTGALSGIFLIANYKLIGAAWMGVIMSVCSALISIYIIHKHLFGIRWPSTLRRPLVITGLLLLLLLAIEKFHLNLLTSFVVLACFYALMTVVVSMHQMGKLN